MYLYARFNLDEAFLPTQKGKTSQWKVLRYIENDKVSSSVELKLRRAVI